MHIWPKNWSWLDVKNITGTLQLSIDSTNAYMKNHLTVAQRLMKPIVLEEFGLPRDFHGYTLDEPTQCRDKYYQNAFAQVEENARKKGLLAGCNFWTFSGTGRPVTGQIHWKLGDDYLGDPPVEEQGLNSVFDTDSTIGLIRQYNQKIAQTLKK
jgi:mannan endo-1,4-beta-mannosidase